MIETWEANDEGRIDAYVNAACEEHAEHIFTLRAENVRRRSSELVTNFVVGIDETPVYRNSGVRLGRDRDRHDIANRIYGTRQTPGKLGCPSTIEDYPQELFEGDLLRFEEEYYPRLMAATDDGLTWPDTEDSIIRCLINGMVLEEGGTMLYAPPKSGKSYTGLLLAQSINWNVNTIWEVQRAARVLYINIERGKRSMTRRLRRVNISLGLPEDAALYMLNRRGRTLADVYGSAAHLVETLGIECVILDSLSRGGFGNLNGNEEANEAMDMLNNLSPSWVAIAHTPRADSTHVFGSQMFDAAMDVGISIKPEKARDGTLGVRFHVKETNDIPAPPPRTLAYEFNQFGLAGVRPSREGEFPELDGEVGEVLDETSTVIADVLAQMGALTVDELAEAVAEFRPDITTGMLTRVLSNLSGERWMKGYGERWQLLGADQTD